jgi:hypothetical protein
MSESIADGKTIVITCKHLAKLGALLFGPVWVPPEELQRLSEYSDADRYGEAQPPKDLITCGSDDLEIYKKYCNSDIYRDPDTINPLGWLMGPQAWISKAGTDVAKDKIAEHYKSKGYHVVRLGHMFDHSYEVGEPVTNIDILDGLFSEGSKFVLQSGIQRIPMVNSSVTDWSEISEFKKDKESLLKYRNLRLWLLEGIRASSLTHAEDILERKLEQYEWSIKKHGLETTIGVVDQFLDPKTLISAVAGAGLGQYMDGPIMAALAGGLVLGGKVLLFAAKRQIEKENIRKYNKDNDVALFYEAIRKYGQKK